MAATLKLSKLGANVEATDEDGKSARLYVTEGQLFDGDNLTVTTPSGVTHRYTLKEGEIDRLHRHGALVPEGDLTGTEVAMAEAAEQSAPDPDEAPVAVLDLAGLAGYDDPAELADLWASSKPTVKDVLAAVGGDKTLAKKAIDAENTATKGDPRATLVAGLQKVLDATPETQQ